MDRFKPFLTPPHVAELRRQHRAAPVYCYRADVPGGMIRVLVSYDLIPQGMRLHVSASIADSFYDDPVRPPTDEELGWVRGAFSRYDNRTWDLQELNEGSTDPNIRHLWSMEGG